MNLINFSDLDFRSLLIGTVFGSVISAIIIFAFLAAFKKNKRKKLRSELESADIAMKLEGRFVNNQDLRDSFAAAGFAQTLTTPNVAKDLTDGDWNDFTNQELAHLLNPKHSGVFATELRKAALYEIARRPKTVEDAVMTYKAFLRHSGNDHEVLGSMIHRIVAPNKKPGDCKNKVLLVRELNNWKQVAELTKDGNLPIHITAEQKIKNLEVRMEALSKPAAA